jgi:hypothetical protein
MNTDLSLAQNHAFQLSRTLVVPVTLFRSGDEFGGRRATNSMTKTIWRSCKNMFRVGLIETLSLLRCRLRAPGGMGSSATAGLLPSAPSYRETRDGFCERDVLRKPFGFDQLTSALTGLLPRS